MKRVILDTNIYGRMVVDEELEEVKELASKKVIIYGSEVIRKEMRGAPRWTTRYPRNLKMDLLRLYDSMIKHSVPLTARITELADKYYFAYRELGGRLPKESLLNDFLIVASASIKKLDIVISEDTESMLNAELQRIYNVVNKTTNNHIPNFLAYAEFKMVIRRLPL